MNDIRPVQEPTTFEIIFRLILGLAIPVAICYVLVHGLSALGFSTVAIIAIVALVFYFM